MSLEVEPPAPPSLATSAGFLRRATVPRSGTGRGVSRRGGEIGETPALFRFSLACLRLDFRRGSSEAVCLGEPPLLDEAATLERYLGSSLYSLVVLCLNRVATEDPRASLLLAALFGSLSSLLVNSTLIVCLPRGMEPIPTARQDPKTATEWQQASRTPIASRATTRWTKQAANGEGRNGARSKRAGSNGCRQTLNLSHFYM